jgi:hypothetical protein
MKEEFYGVWMVILTLTQKFYRPILLLYPAIELIVAVVHGDTFLSSIIRVANAHSIFMGSPLEIFDGYSGLAITPLVASLWHNCQMIGFEELGPKYAHTYAGNLNM